MTRSDCIRNNNPEKNAIVSWIILGMGVLLAVVGAMTTKEYKVNLCLMIGFLVVLGGIAYHLVMVRCPYCRHSLLQEVHHKEDSKYCFSNSMYCGRICKVQSQLSGSCGRFF